MNVKKIFALKLFPVTFLTIIAVFAVQLALLQAQVSYDVILHNGTIIDGSGASRYQADIGIKNGFIAEIGDLSDEEAAHEYNVSGLFVTPGFISVHSHADMDVLDSAKNMLTQGVTTEILNADGSGPANVAAQLQDLEEIDLALNVGAMVGFNGVWGKVIGMNNRHPTEQEFDRMQQLIQNAMRAGAWGVSSGIQYVPGFYASTDEIIRVVKAASPWRTQYSSHIRNEYKKVIQATKEAITTGKRAGLSPMITHMKVVGSKNWGETKITLDLLQNARRQGIYAAADVYPYLAGQASLTILIPQWAQEGGFDTMMKRFANKELRKKIIPVMAEKIELKYGGAENILLPNLGTNLAEAAEKLHLPPARAAVQLMEREQHSISAILFYGSQKDLNRLLQNPYVAVSCDCGSTTDASTHPRYYGSWPKVLGQFVREQNLMTWESAIRKMTGLPATMLGMTRRGFIAEGMIADITIFDPKTIIDRATYQNPKQYAKGVKYVFVNGRAALKQDKVTGIQAGRVLCHGLHMPTRPMSSDRNILISGLDTLSSSKSHSVTVEMNLGQQAEDIRASGTFRLVDPSRGIHIQVKPGDLGKLQATKLWENGWATFTGTVRINKEEQPLLVIVEENAPHDKSEASVVTVQIGDEYKISGSMEVQINLAPFNRRQKSDK